MRARGTAKSIGSSMYRGSEAIAAEIAADETKLKDLYAKRQADERHLKAWKDAELGLARANEILRRMRHIAAQCYALDPRDMVELDAEESALLAYVRFPKKSLT